MKKKQSIEYEKVKLNSHLLDYLTTEDEWKVSQILMNLHDTIIELERGNNEWGSRKRRSAINNEKKKEKEKGENDGSSKLESVVTSPLTPLAFVASESDEKCKKIFEKKPTKRVLEIIDELKQTGELLSTEVEKVRAYHNKLLTYNSVLKAKKDELMSYQKKKIRPLELGRDSKFVMNAGQQEKSIPYYAPHESFRYPKSYYQALQVNGCVPNQNGLPVPLFASSSGLGHVSNQTAPSPYKVPDLNESYSEQAFSFN